MVSGFRRGAGIAVISQPVLAVKPGCTLMGTLQRLFSAGKDRDAGSAEFRGVEGVASGLLNLDISRHGGDRDHAYVGSAESHNEGDGVVGGDVGVNQEGARHPRRITKPVILPHDHHRTRYTIPSPCRL